MPADALPEPWPTPLPGLIHYERDYRDVLNRPLTGSVRITGQSRAVHGDVVITPAAVTVNVGTGGKLAVDLPAGKYELAGSFHTVDGEPVQEKETVTLSPNS